MARAKKKADSDHAIRVAVEQFKIVGNPTRLCLLDALANGGANLGSLVSHMGMTQSAVSNQLSLLLAAKFVEKRRDGQAVVYTLTDLGRVFWELAIKVDL